MTASDTENDNIAIGYHAMTTNTAGGQTILRLVTMLLDALTSGDNNTIMGHNAASNLTTGGSNAAMGMDA